HDVTDSIRTTQAGPVAAEILRIFRSLFPAGRADELKRAFADADRLYEGRHPDYWPCDTEYHDIQHVLEVTLAMARLMEGYQRVSGARALGGEPITPALFKVSS